ncbi:hypothetical protein UT300013_32770 [Paraclostridium sordellii]|nr:MAG TPA: hypothetical protein [Caudoviricetes sp.]
MSTIEIERDCKDSNFKKNFNIKNMKKEKTFKLKDLKGKSSIYAPDLVFYNENRIVFIEQSSNYTKKIHIGEFTQFIDCALNNRVNENIPGCEKESTKFSFFIILTPADDSKSKAEVEANRLRFYWDGIFNKISNEKIETIGVCDCINKNDFKEKELNISYEDLVSKSVKVNIDK